MAEDCNKDMYTLVCKERFDELGKGLERNHKEIIDILKGKNGDPGLIDNVRDNTRMRESLRKITWLFVGAIVVQLVAMFFFFLFRGQAGL